MIVKNLFPLFIASVFAFVSCSKDDNNTPTPELPAKAKEVKNLDASGSKWVYYSFEKNEVVTPTDETKELTWDIAFNGYIIKLNGGTSGQGQGEVVSTGKTNFSEVTKAPESGYVKDIVKKIIISYSPRVEADTSHSETLTGGFGKTTGAIHISPANMQQWGSVYAPTKLVFVLKTANGKYVKFQVTDFYNDRKVPDYPSFQYQLSEDGNF
ncbi:MAG: HmuY family protein [Capnocytophaga sp.]|nr:HmuY family protein [Capnocytophaga sp.]